MRACYLANLVGALVSTLSPLLFVIFMTQFGLSFEQVGRLTLINFFTQVVATLLFSRPVDKYGVRLFITLGHFLVFIGFLLFAFSGTLFRPFPYVGLMVGTLIYSVGGGLLELLISAIVQAIPSDAKANEMSLMHSFYAWGLIVVVLLTTTLVALFGDNSWSFIVLFWSIIPLINFFFFLKVPLGPQVAEHKRTSTKTLLRSPFLLIVLVGIVLGGASEVSMSQWTSAYAESALGLSKTVGDLLGLCLFAALLGLGRTLYGKYGKKIDVWNVMMGGALLAALCYLVAALSPSAIISLAACALAGLGVSLLWPGSIVLATTHYPNAGASIFALLAAGGTFGAAIGPWSLGLVADLVGQNSLFTPLRAAMLVGTLYPLLMMGTLLLIRKLRESERSIR